MLGATPGDNECVPVVEGECGSVDLHVWNEYECCADSDCSEGYACLDNKCTNIDIWDNFFGYDVCTDSDNGFDILVPGTTNHKHYLMGFVSLDELKRDECDPTDNTKIIEYACDETKHIITQTLSCGDGKECITEEGASYCKEVSTPSEPGCATFSDEAVTFKIDNALTSETANVVLKEGEEVEMFGAKVKLIDFIPTYSCPAGWQTQDECSVSFETVKFELSVAGQSYEFNLPMGHIALMENILVKVMDASYTLGQCGPVQPQVEYDTLNMEAGWNMFSVPYSEVTLEGATGSCMDVCSFTGTNFLAFTEYLDFLGVYYNFLETNELTSGVAYFLNTSEACELNLPIVDNAQYSYAGKTLKSGVNSLGGPYTTINVEEALSGCNVVGLATYLNGYWVNTDLTALEPGKGYLVQVDGDCIMSG